MSDSSTTEECIVLGITHFLTMFGIAPTFGLLYYPYLSWVSHSYAHTQIQAPFLNVIQCMYHKLSQKCSLSKLFIKTGGSRNSVSVDSIVWVFFVTNVLRSHLIRISMR